MTSGYFYGTHPRVDIQLHKFCLEKMEAASLPSLEVSHDVSSLAVGQEFSSFQELSSAINQWEAANFVTLYWRSSGIEVESTTKKVQW